MAISFNTGTKNDSGAVAAANVQLTVPAGVLAGDVVFFTACGFNGASGSTLSASSTGTAPTLLIQNQTVLFAGSFSNGAVWYFVAVAADAGKVITITSSSGSVFWAAALAAYTGASTSGPVDVSGGTTNTGANVTVTCPVRTTGINGDWAVYLCASGNPPGGITGPAGTTSRQNDAAASGINAAIFDSNAPVGAAGTSIGGGTFAAAGGNDWWSAFTVGLAPALVSRGQPPRAPDDKPFLKKLLYLS